MKFFVSLASCLVLFASFVSAEEKVPTLKEVIKQVTAQEEALKNLEITEFKLKVEEQKDRQSPWVLSERVIEGSATYDFEHENKCYIQITREKMEWSMAGDPPYEWIESATDYAFDGTGWRTINRFATTLGDVKNNAVDKNNFKLVPANTAILSTDKPMLIAKKSTLGWADGTAFSIAAYQDASPIQSTGRLSDDLLRGSTNYQVVLDTWNDEQLVKVYIAIPAKFVSAYWFDPAKNYAFRKREVSRITPKGQFESLALMEIAKMAEAAPNLWLPIEATVTIPQIGKPGVYQKMTYSAKAIVANNPKLDPSIFVPVIPKKYIIQDMQTNEAFWSDGKGGGNDKLNRSDALKRGPNAPKIKKAGDPDPE
jgi:outer membrane lipoprotein-sorting protein